MNRKIIQWSAICLLGSLILVNCSKSDDQKAFENEAFNIPNDYTQIGPDGKIKHTDLDDWRISPDYSGLVRVRIPAHPNPVLGDRFKIDILMSVIDAIPSGHMNFLIISETGKEYPISYSKRNLTIGSHTIFGQRLISEIPHNEISGLFRIIIFDGDNSVITYGDIQIGQ